jgi:N-acetylmuramoyl-L-alanine amidase
MVELADNAWHACTFNRRSVGVEMSGFASRGFDAPLLATAAPMFAYLCIHLQIPVRHARAGVGPGIASHNELALRAVAITIHRMTLLSWRDSLAWSTASTARAIFPTYGV